MLIAARTCYLLHAYLYDVPGSESRKKVTQLSVSRPETLGSLAPQNIRTLEKKEQTHSHDDDDISTIHRIHMDIGDSKNYLRIKNLPKVLPHINQQPEVRYAN